MKPLNDVPVLRPLLPAAADLMPYLERIDATRWYSNMGPLARAFEAKLADHFGAPGDCVVTSANGTLALVQALWALGARPGSLCVMPSWTFVASAAAAHAAGLKPYFVDVNPATWAMDPSAVEAVIAQGHDVGAVMPVAPFGAPLNLAAWETFQAGTSIPVLVDAAAAFDSFADASTTLPFMVSLHATKTFGIGEGAVIVCPDTALAGTVRQAGNFGFRGSREAQMPGFNAKLSEYAAAIGLAQFDRWPRTRAAWRDITERFARKTAHAPGVKDSPGFGGRWISSYGMVELPSGHHARRVCEVLARRGVETRQWWGDGCHTHAAYRDCPRTALPHTEDLADRTLGLPFWLGLEDSQLDIVFEGLAEAVEAVGVIHPYATADYAASLAHIGQPLAVPEWRGHMLSRPTPQGGRRDAVGPYPITVLPADADLKGGLGRMKGDGMVSAVLVLEDEKRPPMEALEGAFGFVRRFKTHFVYDRRLGPISYGETHRYKVRRALKKVTAAEIALGDHLDAWLALYGELTGRRDLKGLHVFGRDHYETLARIQGVRTFGAFLDDQLVSAHIFMTHDGHAISHLTASAPEGYDVAAAYAVNDLAITALSDCDVVNFGGGTQLDDDPMEGLVRFKRGFSNRTAQSYLCGSILDADGYAALSAGHEDSGFFPAYRGASAPAHADEHGE